MELKRALGMMLFFALLLFAISVIAILTTATDCADINSLMHSSYEYSVLTKEPVLKDDYYQLNAGIGFMVSKDSSSGLNANVLMQSADSEYSKAVDWNTNILSTNGVALSKGLAKSYGLKIGDVIYSKHIVDGTLHEYVIEDILPDVSDIRLSGGKPIHDGIIIMGFDQNYIDNISYALIVYTDDPIEIVGNKTHGTPQDILYRSDEVASVVKRFLPYALIYVFLGMVAAVVMTTFVTRAVKCNFRRMVSLGFEKKQLDRSYVRAVLWAGFLPILVSYLLSITVIQIYFYSFIEAVFITLLMTVAIITLVASMEISKRRLWR